MDIPNTRAQRILQIKFFKHQENSKRACHSICQVLLLNNCKTTTPGEILCEEFLKPLHLTRGELAIKLADTFCTTPDFRLNAQHAVDLYNADLKITTHPAPLLHV